MSNRFDSIPDEALAGMEQVASEALAPSFQLVWWKYPDFKIGEAVITNSEWLALTDEAAWGYVARVHNRLVGEYTVPAIGGKRPSRPDSLRDEDEWELVEKGNNGPWRKDPWEFRTKLPLLNLETNKVAVFTGEGKTTGPAVAHLFADFRKTRRRPLVLLTTAPQEEKPEAVAPFFQIVKRTEHDDKIMGTALARTVEPPSTFKKAASARVAETLPARRNEDMNDEIPF